MTYEDTGPAHDPFAALTPPDPDAGVDARLVGGLGVVLIAALASDVQHTRAAGKNRISLVITGG